MGGNYRSIPIKTKQQQDGVLEGRGQYVAMSMEGWRQSMEDAHICQQNLGRDGDVSVFGVFDGHGGDEVALFVQENFVSILEANANFQKKNYSQALIETFDNLDRLLMSAQGKKQLALIKARKNSEISGSVADGQQQQQQADFIQDQAESVAGCTANVCLITKTKYYVANAGDSRCVFFSNGKTTQMSYDHKPEVQKERERIEKAEGRIVRGRINGGINLTRAIGDLDYKSDATRNMDEQLIISKPDVEVWDIEEKGKVDLIVLGCDGIWECLEQNLIMEHFAQEIKKQDCSKKLNEITGEFLDSIIAKDQSCGKGLDNMSIVVINLNQKQEEQVSDVSTSNSG